MHNNWYDIWNSKQLNETSTSTLASLISADGFDSKYSKIEENAWIEYVQSMAAKLQISPEDSLFEVGCGSGAFLYPFYQKGHPVAGIDYSASLVKIALDVMPKAAISVGDALEELGNKYSKTANKFDIFVSNSVCQYLPNYNYAEMMVRRMVERATKSIGLFDIPDLAKKTDSINLRKSLDGEAAYEEKYRGLEHLYFSQDWFNQILVTEPVKVVIEEQYIPGFQTGSYRFNVFIYKK